jgi:hypothetical protein
MDPGWADSASMRRPHPGPKWGLWYILTVGFSIAVTGDVPSQCTQLTSEESTSFW